MRELKIGDTVFNSPVGHGIITDITDAGYPQINHVAVARFIHKDEHGQFGIFDPHGSYAKGDYELFIDDERDLGPSLSTGTVLVRSSKDVINVVKAIGAPPSRFTFFDHNLKNEKIKLDYIEEITNLFLDLKVNNFKNKFITIEINSKNSIFTKDNKSDLMFKLLKQNFVVFIKNDS